MSQIAATIKVETTRLEKGEVAIIDDLAYEIMATERLFHYVVYTTANLPVGATDIATNIFNLRPEQREIYNIDRIGIDGSGQVRIEFPAGANRNTPHQIVEYLDQILAPKTGGFTAGSRVYFWVVPDRYPTLRVSNPMQVIITTVVYFYGWKYRTRIITAGEVEAKRALGVRVLEADSYYPAA